MRLSLCVKADIIMITPTFNTAKKGLPWKKINMLVKTYEIAYVSIYIRSGK